MIALLDDSRKGLHAAKERLELAYRLRCITEDTETEKAIREAREDLQFWIGYQTALVLAMQHIEDAKQNRTS